MLRSFRLRLALISVLISGLVLLSFGAVTWLNFRSVGLGNLDAELRNFGFRVAGRAGPNVSGARSEINMAEIFGVESARGRFFSLVGRGDQVSHRTGSWPDELDPLSFAGGKKVMEPQPELVDPPPRPASEVRPGAPNPPPARLILEPQYYTVSADGERYRIGVFSNAEVRIVLGANFEELEGELVQIRKAFLIALPGALLVIALGAAFVGRRALRPVEALSERMEHVSAEGLDQRLEVEGADGEFKRIIDAYNVMMGRLENSFHQATRFSADASHELKTPLAVMQGTLEQALVNCPEDSDQQRVYSGLLEEVSHQRTILESLLLLSRADAGQLRISKSKIDLSALIETLAEDAGMLAEEKNLSLDTEIEPGIEIEGDAALLQQVMHNLFSNAVKYNVEGGVLECRLTSDSENVEITVANSGDTIVEEDRGKVFERFFRSRREGDAQIEGVGLGLSLAQEIVLAHGGRIHLKDGDPGMTVFCVCLKK